ncbi:RHS repeat-associated core domain-containing protein [Delftia acidovorans]
MRLPGRHHDRETGLYYNRHRYYDPVVGSYINQDPIGLSGGMNKSIYPLITLQKIDLLGLWASQKGAYVHQRASYLVFGKEISQSQLSAVARGHVWADGAAKRRSLVICTRCDAPVRPKQRHVPPQINL